MDDSNELRSPKMMSCSPTKLLESSQSKYVCMSSGKLLLGLSGSGGVVGQLVSADVLSSISLNLDDCSSNPNADEVAEPAVAVVEGSCGGGEAVSDEPEHCCGCRWRKLNPSSFGLTASTLLGLGFGWRLSGF